MPSNAGNVEDRFQVDGGGKPQNMLFGQPWWRGLNNNGVSPTSASNDSSTRSSSGEPVNGSSLAGPFSLQINGMQDTGASVYREIHTALAPQSAERDNTQETKQVPSSMPQNLGDQSNPQMEFVGHSIAMTSYPFQDPTYAGAMSYAQVQQVIPQLYGLHQSRMPLPLAMEEEPVYVNAKQYHGILRRRQSRAKAELEKKVIKARKPYLHESRHVHALRRARGAGGRFLNTKKLDGNDANNAASKANANTATNLQICSSGSARAEHLSTTYCANAGSSWNQQESRGLMISDIHKADSHSSGSTNVHGLSSTYLSFSGANEERNNYGQGGMKVNGAVSVK
ncbi:nuclear transcription factor Y subunit A-4-like isoform X2 [Chenopodium quinoa]|uniref:nuclear transcription factor Y subunit A-4-like isoform X2 n=1 Tax=Chenopodium quinoa TaxID=63459 RepID=UPI000B788068|nr:nuclear transcription factor Y subunit A-4-like isoform X2 [Chenopodium quinoa]